MRIVFFGTPLFAAHCLEYLLQHDIQIAAVVTQPDRPKGRSLQVSPSSVKALILEKAPQIPIFQPQKASDSLFLEELARLKADLFAVVAFGQILSQKLLDIPPLGCINVHASLLPKFRGAAPIHRALMEGERQTGVAIQKMVRQLDAGDVIATAKMPIPADMIFGELEAGLLELSKPLLLSVLHLYEKAVPRGEPQDPKYITYAAKIESKETEIHWDEPAQKIHNQIRGLSPRPGAWCWVSLQKERKRLKILRSQLAAGLGKPGTFLSETGIIACGQGALQILEVQPEGKRAMKAADFIRGCKNISF